MKKQMKYANSIQVPFVALLGGDEMEKRVVTMKNMLTGEQETVEYDDLEEYFDK
jgi:histidyl-tRNA synthetase